MKSIGHAGLNNLLAAYEDKSARAVCTFAYSAGPGHEPILFQGITEGKIVPARGAGNFGMFCCRSGFLTEMCLLPEVQCGGGELTESWAVRLGSGV
jgi:hypothetical protein